MSKDDIADAILENYATFAKDADDRAAAPSASTREILDVKRYTLYSSSFVQSRADPLPRSGVYIHCKGVPTPSSVVTYGYIHFAAPDALKKPFFNRTRKELRIWVDIAGLAQVLTQLGQANRYLWVGEFNNGHIYGDLHSWD